VNRLFLLILSIFILNHCSFNEKSRIWNKEKKTLENQKNIKKVFKEEKKIITGFNQNLKLDFSKLKTNNKIIDITNNYGSQNYNGLINRIGNYKFSKLKDVNQLNFKPLFLNNGLIFFDKKGSIIKYDDNKKILWKKNHYTKSEKKLGPTLNFALVGENLLVTDSIGKYYSVNVNTGELNWTQNSSYPFNSEIKNTKSQFFVIDYKNTLRCYNISDGSECWNLQTEDSFTISDSKFSLIVNNNIAIFNNSIGDITATDINTGMIVWQLPTQSSNILNETYNFKNSKLVSDTKSIYFSNNKNEFYSIDIKTGTINWKNEINSNLTPIIIGNLILTVSIEGYLYVVEKNKGNVIRITDLYSNYKTKKRKNIKPTGFVIGKTKLYLSNTDGKIIVSDIVLGNVVDIIKVSGDFISQPFIYNQSLFVIRNGSIIQYN